MRSWLRLSALVILLASGGCYNKGMVGAATKVTGGRIFKINPRGHIEQQQIFELQSLNLEPGQLIRYGGTGDTSSLYIVEYGSKVSAWRVEEYVSDATSEDLRIIKGEIEKIDQLGVTLVDVELELATERSALRLAELHLAEAIQAIQAVSITDAIEKPKEGDKEEKPEMAAASEATEDKESKTQEAEETKQPDIRRSKLAALTASLEHLAAVHTASNKRLIAATERRNNTMGSLEKAQIALDKATDIDNLIIFRWSETAKGSGQSSLSDKLSVTSSRSREQSGLAIVAGLRRSRLVIGYDLDDLLDEVDPERKISSWWSARWSATGVVTQAIQVQRIEYFTEGKLERKIDAIISASPEEFAGMLDPSDLAKLKITLSLHAERIAKFQNRASLTNPTRSRKTVDWKKFLAMDTYEGPPTSTQQQGKDWMTIAVATASLRYLCEEGRIKNRWKRAKPKPYAEN